MPKVLVCMLFYFHTRKYLGSVAGRRWTGFIDIFKDLGVAGLGGERERSHLYSIRITDCLSRFTLSCSTSGRE